MKPNRRLLPTAPVANEGSSHELKKRDDAAVLRRTRGMSVLLSFTIMVSAYAGTARAEDSIMLMTGNSLLAYCEGDFQDQALCLGYVEGVADFSFSRQGAGLAPCVPAGIIVKQIQDVVVTSLLANPAQRHFAAPMLIINAITDAWHCKGLGDTG